MAAYIFLDRRSGVDRRHTQSPTEHERRSVDRRHLPNNHYLLIVGNSGLDSFELLVIMPIITVISAMMLGSFLGSF